MDQRTRRLAMDDAITDIDFGVLAGILLTGLRAIVPIAMLVGNRSMDWALFAEYMIQMGAAGVLTYFTRKRRRWAAIIQFVTFALIYVYVWAISGRLLPPVGLVGVGIFYGLYRGFRGANTLARLSAEHTAEPLPEMP